jgi:glycosyltransferase involved in cell wall biosynthesis
MVLNQIYHTDTRVISYANALVETGAQVHVVSSKESNDDSLNPKPGITLHPVPLARNNDGGLSYVINYLLSIILFTLYTTFLHFRYNYDVIHIHNMPDTLVLSALLPKLFGAKVILDIHDPMPNMFMSKFGVGAESSLVKFLKIQERVLAKLADEVITANPIFKEELSARGIPAEKITVVNNIPNPNLFDRQRAQEAISQVSEKFTLIYPGTLASRYSLDIPIRALTELKKHIPNIQLTIIGKKNEYADDLVKLSSELGVSKLVDFTSHLPASQVALEIAKADVGVYTAIPDAHMDIAMPGKVLEYVVMGIPVVASRLRILEAFFDDTSLLFFAPGVVEEFISQILKLHSDQALRKELIENADQVFTYKYTWKNEYINYLMLIDKLTSPHN